MNSTTDSSAPGPARLRRLLLLSLLLLSGAFWYWHGKDETSSDLKLYGTVDLRQIALAFNNSERISEVLAEEGDRVHPGQIIARLETARLASRVLEAEGQLEAQRQVVTRLRNGSRPEEVAEARANAEAAKADAEYARQQYRRLTGLAGESSGRAVSVQDLDNSRAAMISAQQRFQSASQSLDLMVLGPRQEEIAQAEAQLRANSGQLQFLREQLRDAELRAPVEAIVRSRLLEPGEISTPQRPVFTLARIDPKWVRAYVSESRLGQLHLGMVAHIQTDSYPQKVYEGRVGFISPIAEFTPKPVQTEELRPLLSYEVRVFVKDPTDQLRLGMPATVTIPLADEQP